jgi:hypothetical protein
MDTNMTELHNSLQLKVTQTQLSLTVFMIKLVDNHKSHRKHQVNTTHHVSAVV